MSASRILVIEDAPDIVLALRIVLERAGYEVAAAAYGSEGLRLFEETSPDLVLLDVGLPGIDGFAVLARIRESSRVPVVLLTARVGEHDRERGLALGATAYLTKPLGFRDVPGHVARLLDTAGD